jgi:formylglycine-generating enzyme required for sulfatase activity
MQRAWRVLVCVLALDCDSTHVRVVAPKHESTPIVAAPSSTVAREPACDVHVDQGPSGLTDDGMVRIPSAVFEMDTRCVHVTAFDIDRTEVTVADYTKCFDARRCTDTDFSCFGCELPLHPKTTVTRRELKDRRPTHPVRCVTYSQAETYCAWVHKRLPADEEWELAARNTDGRPTSNAPSRETSCWGKVSTMADEPGSPCPVGSFATDQSPFGVLDMMGSVSEWTTTTAPQRNSHNDDDGGQRAWRIVRGESYGRSPGWSANEERGVRRRGDMPAEIAAHTTGFRCARSN